MSNPIAQLRHRLELVDKILAKRGLVAWDKSLEWRDPGRNPGSGRSTTTPNPRADMLDWEDDPW